MKIITTSLITCLLLITGMVAEAMAGDVVVTAEFGEEGTWNPLADFPEFFPSREFVESVKVMAADNPAAAETLPWRSERESNFCPRPLVFAVEEMLFTDEQLMDHQCFIFLEGRMERLTRSTSPEGIELMKYAGKVRRFPTNATYFFLGANGGIDDNLSRPGAGVPGSTSSNGASYCVTQENRTTCSLPELPEPVCTVVKYLDADVRMYHNLRRDMPLTSCYQYVEGRGLYDREAVQGDVCYVKTTGDGKVVADCAVYALIDHREGSGDVFSQLGDSVIIGTQQDKYFVDPANVNLLFIKRVEGMPPARVIGSGDSTRIIAVGVDQEM